mmetsp:Transcript_19188/g.48345  ORF Transcript_19188/g.48345 Transcript_19188/m.48345 type:complete len:91 (+) Transcript_19188:2-274(+)
MPPHMSFDDPDMKFDWSTKQRPAPAGSTVRYEISLIDLESSASSGLNKWSLLSMAFLVLMVAGAIVFVLRVGDKSSPKGKSHGKERKKKK